MLKSSSSIAQGRPIGVVREYISQIHSLLTSLMPDYHQNSSYSLTDDQITQLNSIPQFSCFRQVAHKCMQIHETLFTIIINEKDIVSRVLGLIQQIQQVALNTNSTRYSYNLQSILIKKVPQLKASLYELPFSHFQLKFDHQKNYHKNSDFLFGRLKKQNTELKQKVLKFEEKTNILQQKLINFYRQIKMQQIKSRSQEKLINRLRDRIFNQEFIVKANEKARNEIQNLRQQNKKLIAQLKKSKQINIKLKERYEIETKINKRKLNQTRQKQLRYQNIPDWAQAINNLQRQINCLRTQRRKQQKIISSLHNKLEDLQMGQSVKNSSTVAAKNEYGRKQIRKVKLQLPETQIDLITSNIQELQKITYKSGQNNKWLNIQKRLKTQNFDSISSNVKSTLTLKQYPIHNSMAERQITKVYFHNKNNRKIDNEEQQLKNSGYFNQPGQISYSSNTTDKGNSKNFHRRGVTQLECKTPSTLY